MTTKKCPVCGGDNSEKAKFCRSCGTPLQTRSQPAPLVEHEVAADPVEKATEILENVASTASRIESTVTKAAQIGTAAHEISQIVIRPPAEWQVVVGDMLPSAGEKIVEHGVNMVEQKVQQAVNQKISEVFLESAPPKKSGSARIKNLPETFVPVEKSEKSGGQYLCPSCNYPITPGAKFCRHCGEPVGVSVHAKNGGPAVYCPSCGKEQKPGAKFCRYCGTKL